MTVEHFVLDTNVLISAALTPAGRSRAVVDAIRDAHGVLLFSKETFGELRTRFHRSRFDRYVSRDAR
jgi:putative PIN family toxin of toxin-antitoxin system